MFCISKRVNGLLSQMGPCPAMFGYKKEHKGSFRDKQRGRNHLKIFHQCFLLSGWQWEELFREYLSPNVWKDFSKDQRNLPPVSTLSLRPVSCLRSCCRIHFLYGSSLDTHWLSHTPHCLCFPERNEAWRHHTVPVGSFTMKLCQRDGEVCRETLFPDTVAHEPAAIPNEKLP